MAAASSSSRHDQAAPVCSQPGTRLCSAMFSRGSGMAALACSGCPMGTTSAPFGPPPGSEPAFQAVISRASASRLAWRARHDSIRSTTLGCMHDYRERLRVPLAWWLLAVPSVLILGATLSGLAEPWPIIIMVGLLAGCAAFLIALGLAAIEVRDGAVRAGNAALPLTAVSEVVTLDEKQTTRLRGPRADPAAHLYSRPYLKESVYLAVAPSGSATPYWLIGTRHPAELAAVIERCRVQAGHEPVA